MPHLLLRRIDRGGMDTSLLKAAAPAPAPSADAAAGAAGALALVLPTLFVG